MKNSNYPTAQWLMYATLRLLISNCRNKQSEFLSFSPAYNDTFLSNLNLEVDSAEALPSEEMLAQEHSQLLD